MLAVLIPPGVAWVLLVSLWVAVVAVAWAWMRGDK